jgi:hypothetical protein
LNPGSPKGEAGVVTMAMVKSVLKRFVDKLRRWEDNIKMGLDGGR